MNQHGIDRARRRFIQASALTGAGLILAGCNSQADNATPVNNDSAAPPGNQPAPDTWQPPKGEGPSGLTYGALLCGGRLVHAETGEERFIFTQLNIDRTIQDRNPHQKEIMDIGFLAHGVIKNPFAEERVLVFEKKGPGAAEIDLKANAIATRIEPAKGCEFYGHGAYSADGRLIYATEYEKSSYEGKMTIRDARNFSVIDEFPTYGEWPHDCQFIENGKVVAITNGGGNIDGGAQPCVTFVDVEKGELIEKITFDNAQINAGHLMLSSRLDLAVTHAMREGLDNRQALGAISLRPAGAAFKTMISPASVTSAMKGETLSLCMHEEKKIVAATNPYGAPGGLVTFWNYETGEFVDKLEIEQPRGIGLSLDRKHWVLTFGAARPGVILLSTETHKPSDPAIVFEASSQGSHAYIHDYFAA
ncbi:MAG: DUF1513 domain-containing protein [Planctomycetes bacterium]|nr:DUF1513 domain-containing protein [Planctomycetota bacterium]